MTGYTQLVKLDFPLGGTAVMDGYPLPPLTHMPGADHDAAKANATYYGDDMNWMIWWGADDPIFPASYSLQAWEGILDVLGVKGDVLKVEHTEPGMTHTLVKAEFDQLLAFIGATAGNATAGELVEGQ